MRGTIYNPSVQIFTQRDKSASISQERRAPSVELSFSTPYTAMDGERTGARETKRERRERGQGKTQRGKEGG